MKNTVTETNILPVVEEWADSLIGEIPEITMTSLESHQLQPDTQAKAETKTCESGSQLYNNQTNRQQYNALPVPTSGIEVPTRLVSSPRQMEAGTVRCDTTMNVIETVAQPPSDVYVPESCRPRLEGEMQSRDESNMNDASIPGDEDSDATIDGSQDDGCVDSSETAELQVKMPQSEEKLSDSVGNESMQLNERVSAEAVAGNAEQLVGNSGVCTDKEMTGNRLMGSSVTTSIVEAEGQDLQVGVGYEVNRCEDVASGGGEKVVCWGNVWAVLGRHSQEAEAGGLKETDSALVEESEKQAVYVLASKLLTKWNLLEVCTKVFFSCRCVLCSVVTLSGLSLSLRNGKTTRSKGHL